MFRGVSFKHIFTLHMILSRLLWSHFISSDLMSSRSRAFQLTSVLSFYFTFCAVQVLNWFPVLYISRLNVLADFKIIVGPTGFYYQEPSVLFIAGGGFFFQIVFRPPFFHVATIKGSVKDGSQVTS